MQHVHSHIQLPTATKRAALDPRPYYIVDQIENMAVLLLPANKSLPMSIVDLAADPDALDRHFSQHVAVTLHGNEDHPKLPVVDQPIHASILAAKKSIKATKQLPYNERFATLLDTNAHLNIGSIRPRGDAGITFFKQDAPDRPRVNIFTLFTPEAAIAVDSTGIRGVAMSATHIFSFFNEWLRPGHVRFTRDLLQINLGRGPGLVHINGHRVENLLPKHTKSCFVCRATEGLTVCGACQRVAYCRGARCQQALGGHNCPGRPINTRGVAHLGNLFNPPKCATCGTLGTMEVPVQACAACQAVKYCSVKCQKAGWKAGHKQACHT